MTLSIYNDLDNFLAKSDHESMDWCDGGQAEVAEGLLEKFDEADWNTLSSSWRSKSALWQACLVSILCPKYGVVAQDILIEIASCSDPELAYEAMDVISFYCGINANSDGPFIDESIEHKGFKARLCANPNFLESIPIIGELVGREYEMLQSIFRDQPLF